MIDKKVKLSLMYELENLHHVVVQASDVGSKYVYALQLLHKQTDTVVYRTDGSSKHAVFDENDPIVYLTGMAGGHTQTWTYSGEKDRWFIGTKPKKHGSILWDTQIARIKLPESGTLQYDSNTEMPRLSYLNRAGYGYGDGSVAYPGKDLERLEAAVSPAYQRLLIASIDVNHIGHFALYDLNEVNEALDAAEADASDVNIQNLHCLGAFNIPNFNQTIPSIQGYDIDKNNNVYVSCQLGPTTNFLGLAKEGHPRQIVKIPWGCTDPDKWEVANLDHDHTVDSLGYVTEFESVQVINPNQIYLTVAYHSKSDLTTLKNRVYKVEGFGD
ncbi:class III bacteriocin [Lactobacillus hamsteri]|uniref:Bacteriocin helveticin-J n=1 Tax=Lactobacillus hamsteri DSM 5661 = JCM 6256 TaxID=1423754 RepID=A0A0R1YEK0_9LACO|nr:class III bacteriocin [Lactobacillus hamsteri]KRM40912.1 bacteriocin helveticin-J [Lactobacillus hamsteri DSM 5661 = JCM 6256]